MLKRANLIITRAGKNALYRNWLTGADRNFDLLVVAYNPEGLDDPVEDVAYDYEPTSKVAGWRGTFKRMPELLDQYDYIAMIDDDIDTDAAVLNFCFDEGRKLDLLIWQPALSWNSYATFAGLLQNRYPLRQWHRDDVPFFPERLSQMPASALCHRLRSRH